MANYDPSQVGCAWRTLQLMVHSSINQLFTTLLTKFRIFMILYFACPIGGVNALRDISMRCGIWHLRWTVLPILGAQIGAQYNFSGEQIFDGVRQDNQTNNHLLCLGWVQPSQKKHSSPYIAP